MPPNAQPPKLDLVRATVDDHEMVCDLIDSTLRGDAYIPKGQVLGILKRPTSDVWIVHVDGQCAGFAIMYRGSSLHNLHLAPWARSQGVGSQVLDALRPKVVRSKTNMRDGDPTPFYLAHGYQPVAVDAARPHIRLLTRDGPANEPEVKAHDPNGWMPPFKANEEMKALLIAAARILGMNPARTAKARTAGPEVPQVKDSPRVQSSPGESTQISENASEKNIVIPREEYDQLVRDRNTLYQRREKQAGYQRKRFERKKQEKMRTGPHFLSDEQVNISSQVA